MSPKLDPRDNTYKLLEVNPKFWGTTDLSIKAGIDFPRMACEIAKNGDTSPKFDYKAGLTYRWAAPATNCFAWRKLPTG